MTVESDCVGPNTAAMFCPVSCWSARCPSRGVSNFVASIVVTKSQVQFAVVIRW